MATKVRASPVAVDVAVGVGVGVGVRVDGEDVLFGADGRALGSSDAEVVDEL
jgi:hypothetical protein